MYFYILASAWLNMNKLKFIEMLEAGDMAEKKNSAGGVPVYAYIILIAGIYYGWTLLG